MSYGKMLRRALLAAASAALILLAWPILGFFQADLDARTLPQTATVSSVQSITARALWLEQAADEVDSTALRREAQRLLLESPMRGVAYRALALVAEREGDTERAAQLHRSALRRTPRDEYSRAWLADQAAASGDWSAVVEHSDALLRISGRSAAELFKALIVTASHPVGLEALVRVLGEQAPPWRAGFINRLVREAPLVLVDAVLAPLRDAPEPLSISQRDLWIDRLVREGEGARAYFLWLESLPDEQHRELANVFDGGFELAPGNSGFGWRFDRIAGVSVDRRYIAGAAGRSALLIDFHGQRVAFQHVRQRLALMPGEYRLSGRVRPEGLQNERGLQWRLRCESGTALTETARFTGQSDWREFESSFSVPAEGCSSQWLQLYLAGRIPAERWAVGRIWFDDLRISWNQPAG